MLEVSLLGPVEARVLGVGVSLSPLERNLLAVLALARGQVISTDRIIDCLWGDRIPASPRGRVQGLVSSLRRKVGEALVTRQPGYLLDLAKHSLDLDMCEDLAHQGCLAPAARVTAERLREALALWRGEPLDGVSAPGLDVDRARLTELRIGILEERFDAELELGNHTELVGELTATVSAHPLRERLAAQLMLALYRCNRQADALKVYHSLRERLANDLGSDPCADVRNLHATILRGGDEIRQASPEPAIDRPRPPAQLPPGVGHFTGRDDELAALTLAMTEQSDEARVFVVTGLSGLGKTALVVHWAHSVRDRFPDGQIFMDLRGDEPGDALSPRSAVTGLLLALDVGKSDIPGSLDECVALYRTLVHTRRILIVADNAGSVEQLTALVPPTPGSLLVATSRRRLSALATRHAVWTLVLDPLAPEAAYDLLRRIVGVERLRDPGTGPVLDWCGGWPLAIRVAGAKLSTRIGQSLLSFAEDLRDHYDGRLLDDGPRSLYTALTGVYQDLSPAAARLFSRLALCADTSICLHFAAAAAGTSVRQVRWLLDELTAVHLVVEIGDEHYRFHNLIRRFARGLGTELLDREPADEWAFGLNGHGPRPAGISVCPAQGCREVNPPARARRNGVVAAQ